jgi:hypothetical protein
VAGAIKVRDANEDLIDRATVNFFSRDSDLWQWRRGEILGLRRRDIDILQSVIGIEQSRTFTRDGSSLTKSPKTAAGRRILSVPSNVTEVISEHLERFSSADPDALVFTGVGGELLAVGVLQKAWSNARRTIERPDLDLHDLRHTGLTLAAATGATTAELMHRVGSGSLLIAATHEKFRETRFVGVDVDPLAVETAKWNVQIRSMCYVDTRQSDFLFDDPPDQPDAVICNPPYTRHHDISSERKSAIHRGIVERLGLDLYRSSSLHVLFLVRAIEISAPGARLAFITPSNWLDKSYAAAVKRFVLEEAHVNSIINLPVGELIFDRAITTASITNSFASAS